MSLNKKKFMIGAVIALALSIGVAAVAPKDVWAAECQLSVLSTSYCGEDGLANFFRDAKTALDTLVLVGGALGIAIAGIMWATALDNEGRAGQAKKRLGEIALGLVIYGLISVITGAFMGGGGA